MAEKADDLKTREEKIAQAKELYSRGSRNYLVKLYSEAADDLSQVCGLYEELYGNLADELGMPYLLYAKSLLALEEYKVIDVPDEEEDDDDDDDDADEEEGSGSDATVPGTTTEENGGSKDKIDSTLPTINEDDEENEEKIEKKETSNKDATSKEATSKEETNKEATSKEATSKEATSKEETNNEAVNKEAEIKEDKQKNNETEKDKEDIGEKPELPSSTSHIDITDDEKKEIESEKKEIESEKKETESEKKESADKIDNAVPSTSNGKVKEDGEETTEDADEAATNLQLAWEILELAAKIFERQGESALPNLAEVKTELGNIQFENNILDAAREDYNNALKIYDQLPSKYRRAMAEIHYKIGLTYLSQEQQSCKESAESLRKACEYLDEEIKEAKDKPDLTEQDKLNIEDMEETRQEIWVKITEIEETRQQCLAEVRAALDNYKSPSKDPEMAGPSSSSSVSSKPATDISHLIKRKKPDSTTSDAGPPTSSDVGPSPAKRPAL